MTSLVLYVGAPLWLALTLGVLAVVGLPVIWDMWAESRFLRRQNPQPRILTRADRIRLRILVVSAAASAFLVVAVAYPTTNALAKRGDWLLFGSQGAFANDMRGAIGSVASSLAGLTGTSLDVAVASSPTPTPQSSPCPHPRSRWLRPRHPSSRRRPMSCTRLRARVRRRLWLVAERSRSGHCPPNPTRS